MSHGECALTFARRVRPDVSHGECALTCRAANAHRRDAVDLPRLFLGLSQASYRRLKENRVAVDGLVLLVPTDVAATVVWPGLIDTAHVVFGQKLAGLVAFLDTLLAGLGNLDDMPFSKSGTLIFKCFARRRMSSRLTRTYPAMPATQRRAFQAVEPLM